MLPLLVVRWQGSLLTLSTAKPAGGWNGEGLRISEAHF